ncbi:hypothetical protein IDSA_04485 [Pseudidiomarina salinarum]|uniref:ABC transmembrane type-1 domain-containing protein n=1 Tax=Pseudidiomarina salinarum TaxID=435908 RepID=A0A094J1L4_9GAMM|nr:hypothetical protein [Pseudidiomarina salinarum]KFZ31939.1 hypothetical protein IDSA_04485 [Pseudidiomarina salinarum]RUO70284.1 hypothetical protein CWI79_02100 [Pseudidiomarina salinarum]
MRIDQVKGQGGLTLALLGLGLPLIAALTGILFSAELLNLTALFRYPGLPAMVWQGLLVAVVVTVTATLVVMVSSFSISSKGLRSIIAIPNLAFTVGILWLITPTGWLWRLLPGIEVNLFDRQYLLTFIVILLLKEIPFLLFMSHRALQQIPHQKWLLIGQSQGHSKTKTWWLIVMPALLKRLRFPLMVVAVYSFSVIDIALLAAPNLPSTLAVQVFEWQLNFTPEARQLAYTGGLLLLVLSGALCLGVIAQEYLFRQWSRKRLASSVTAVERTTLKLLQGLRSLPLLTQILGLLALAALVAQSVSRGWFYPALLPADWTLQGWLQEWQYIWPGVINAFAIAAIVGLFSVLLVIVLLELRRKYQWRYLGLWVLLPLFIPQVLLVLSWQHAISYTGPVGYWIWVIWSHIPFSVAYAYLVLAPQEQAFDQRYLLVSRALGYSFWRSWWRVKRPLLAGPLYLSLALAMVISITQYVPTLILGGGRVATVTTDLMAASSGINTQLAAIYALMQWLLATGVLIGLTWQRGSSAGEQ